MGLAAAGLALGLFFTPDNGKNRGTRMAMLLGFGFLTGLGMGPMLQLAMMMNPTIVPSAFMVTSDVWTLNSSLAGIPQHLLQIHPLVSGSPLDWTGSLLWLHHVRHPDDHQKSPQRRQGLHC